MNRRVASINNGKQWPPRNPSTDYRDSQTVALLYFAIVQQNGSECSAIATPHDCLRIVQANGVANRFSRKAWHMNYSTLNDKQNSKQLDGNCIHHQLRAFTIKRNLILTT